MIAQRFCGPPQSGNGGYVAGRLAEHLRAPRGVAVRLHAPPPLETALAVRAREDGVDLFHGDTRLASARPVSVDLVPPAAPDFEAARRAAEGFRGFRELIFPRCFVCGFQRSEGDGLRIFPGDASSAADGSLFAAPWVPDASLRRDEADVVRHEFLWAALDCPGAFSFPQPEGRVVLLGEMRVRIDADVAVGERCVLTSWYVEGDGRKHVTGSAIHGETGECRGLARGTWIEIDPASVPRE